MSELVIDVNEFEECKELFEFLNMLDNNMKEKVKTILWWEFLKKNTDAQKIENNKW